MDDTPRDVDRILVALDASPHSRAAVNAAVRLARVLRADLRGLFIEDASLIRTANLPFASEVRAFSADPRRLTEQRIERQMRDRAERAKHHLRRLAEDAGVDHQFDTARGEVVDEVIDAAGDADLLAFGKAGEQSSRRRLGAKARALLAESPAPVLVLRERLRYFQPVLTYYDGSDPAAAAARLAARLARRSDAGTLKVLAPGDDTARFASLRSALRRTFRNRVSRLYVRAVTRSTPARLAATAREERSGLAVLPDLLSSSNGDTDPQDFLYKLDSPTLLVK